MFKDTASTVLDATPITVGLDLGDKYSHFCELDSQGVIAAKGKLRTTKDALGRHFEGRCGVRVVIETGTHSPWIAELLQGLGLEVILANARNLRAIWSNPRKSDSQDAQMLARLGRADPKLLHPVVPRTPEVRADLTLLRARACLVEQRTRMVCCVRGLVKSAGFRLATCSAASFHRQDLDALPVKLRDALAPMLEELASTTSKIRHYDRQIAKLCDRDYPQTHALMQVCGVGPLTALCFVLIVGDPSRFRRSRDLPAYLGLVPGRDQSGEHDPQMHITKTGNKMLRTLLVQCGHYILGHFGKECDLRTFGKRLETRGGKYAKKKAVIATARKLSVLLLALWRSGKEYEANRNHSSVAQSEAEMKTAVGMAVPAPSCI